MEKMDKKVDSTENPQMPLGTRNYKILAVGFALIVLGFALMSGGGSDDPMVFDYAIFSWRRITLAPIVVVVGFVVEIYAILSRK
ncbi:MAG: DUF3098 domain-containing protein [Rikenellaceae bacterium]